MKEDTIAAISTPMGEGGIGIIRISGEESFNIAKKLFYPKSKISFEEMKPRTMYLGNIYDDLEKYVVDEVLMVKFKAPNSYTAEDMVEIHSHGGFTAVRKILNLVLRNGARLAQPGEFTKRAFINGRIDLSQAEAVIDIIRAKTDKALKVAVDQLKGKISEKIKEIMDSLLSVIALVEANIDFPEEEIPEASPDIILKNISYNIERLNYLKEKAGAGKILREGISTVIVGKPNVGKSSLLNSLLMEKRAIVTEIPGTTRDVIEEYINVKGIPIKIIDTAGIRDTKDPVEKIGVERAMEKVEGAELVLFVVDASGELEEEDYKIMENIKEKRLLIIFNKIDLGQKIDEKKVKEHLPGKRVVKISALRDEGIELLREEIYELIVNEVGSLEEGIIITAQRHIEAINKAIESLKEAKITVENNLPMEISAIYIREAWEYLGEITGDSVKEDILDAIFENFCIGK
ncbi:tRNA uridine-5-carboxymethylaminomethyl(34) synthesis GTPase MnmE [Thermovenabulum gondwanense]|uniref:tRNA modification GTPase MnmE n=1 Tax=Thermovenabulum gondwanense TaxID=520767 RepID=A0A162MSP7_9FIRM|nr:tRNA uridine-5-carboxymethylaminomethyl(34) synthesis GTPase MnmE [Thermovenabulum gondwanense]KYO67242.1 tRNA modification GTPase MnmE [Thermovenabulum gondwanense]